MGDAPRAVALGLNFYDDLFVHFIIVVSIYKSTQIQKATTFALCVYIIVDGADEKGIRNELLVQLRTYIREYI